MKIRRREFIRQSLAGVGGLMAGSNLLRGAEEKPKHFEPFETVTLGQTKLKVPLVGFGTGFNGWLRSSNQKRLGAEKLTALIRGAYERGVRLFDMADLYGTHPYLIPALKEIPRKKFKIVSKIWWNKGGIPEKERPDPGVVVQRFLKELKTDYIDLVLLHCVTSKDWPKELETQMNIMSKLKKKGIIRAHGVSCHSVDALQACVEERWVDSVHARINPSGVKMDDMPEKVVPILKQVHQKGKGVVGMKIVAAGTYAKSPTKRARSIDFVLNLGCVDTMIVGFEKVDQIDDFTAMVAKTERRNPAVHKHKKTA